MINRAMKEKLTRPRTDLEEFRQGLNHDIGKSLSILARSRAPEAPDRNFMGEFRSLLRNGKAAPGGAPDGSGEVKSSYLRWVV